MGWKLLHIIEGTGKWLARCDCGRELEVFKSNISSNKSTQCKYCYAEKQKTTTNFLTHGLSKKHRKLYNVWCGIKRRCYNKNQKSYKDYGAKGVIMCDEWLNSFKVFSEWAFENGYKEGLEITRFKDKGNYKPENCEFKTKAMNISEAHKNKIVSKEQLDKYTKTVTGLRDEDLSVIVSMSISGNFKCKEIAEKFNIERHTVTRLTKRAGKTPNYKGNRNGN